jgi:hypothetical protein
MTLFGSPNAEHEEDGVKRKLYQMVLAGGAFTGSGAVVFGIIELVKSQPDKAFRLLETWGPWFFLAMFAVWAANGLMNRGVDVVEKMGDRFAGSLDRMAETQEKQVAAQEKQSESYQRLASSQDLIAAAAKESASAAQQLADKDNREAERTATLVEYAASQSRQAMEAVTQLVAAVNKMSDHVEKLPGKGD